ncbi:MAG: WD40/YVTN/BNR-like repeat-containing protein, partial [Vicinamibacterales bacterium]
AGFHWREIGPAGQGARIDDFAVDEKNPSTYYIGYATSGVWKTTNNGTTFEPIFETYGASSIGDLALAPSNPSILWVGTGEANNRQTTTFGNGLWKSTDAGAHFTLMGFADSQSIARIVVNPTNPDIALVAVAGHLFGPSEDRGIFRTTDGGKTWKKTLYVDASTGGTDVIFEPGNPKVAWAAMYQHRRLPYGYVGGGPGSGLYKSTDAGETWTKQTGHGLPHGTMGRITFDISRSNPKVMYALIEVAQDKEPPGPPPAEPQRGGGAGGFGGGGGGGRGAQQPPNPQSDGLWKSVDAGKTWEFMNNGANQRPMYFSQVRVDPNDANTIYVGGLNALKSTDGGKTMVSIEGNKGHVDNHAIWIDPGNSQHVMYGNDGGEDVSYDAGKTWESVRLTGVGLAYRATANMDHPYEVCVGLQDNGSWCGPSSMRSPQGIRMWDWMSVGGGDGFQNAMDQDDPAIFYTESQNLGIQRYDVSTGESRSIKPRIPGNGRGGGNFGGFGGNATSNIVPEPAKGTPMAFNWNSPIELSPFNSSKIYVGGKELFVSLNRGDTWRMSQPLAKNIDLDKETVMGISYGLPSCQGGEGSPGGQLAGPGHPCIISKGDGFTANEYGSLTEIAVSPVQDGIVWVGTDDGNIQVSKDDGHTWTEVGKNIPGVNNTYYVSGLEASHFDAGTAYVAIDGHRNDDLKPYVFKTTDFGQTWTSVSGNLPNGNVNSIREDPVNRNLLFAPTEFGFYISLNDGQAWDQFMPELPYGLADEVMVHPREHDLILASHAYGVRILDDITPLEEMTPQMTGKDVALFKPRDAVAWKNDIRQRTEVPGSKFWEGANAPRGTAIAWLLKSKPGAVTVKIADTATGEAVYECKGSTNQGLNRFQWTLENNLTVPPAGRGGRGGEGGGRGGAAAQGPRPVPGSQPCGAPPENGRGRGGFGRGGFGAGIQPGVYRVTVNVDGKDVENQTFSVLEDTWMK